MYEERVIDGVLCHRNTTDEDFEPYTSKELTTTLEAMKDLVHQLRDKLSLAQNRLKAVNIAATDYTKAYNELGEEIKLDKRL